MYKVLCFNGEYWITLEHNVPLETAKRIAYFMLLGGQRKDIKIVNVETEEIFNDW